MWQYGVWPVSCTQCHQSVCSTRSLSQRVTVRNTFSSRRVSLCGRWTRCNCVVRQPISAGCVARSLRPNSSPPVAAGSSHWSSNAAHPMLLWYGSCEDLLESDALSTTTRRVHRSTDTSIAVVECCCCWPLLHCCQSSYPTRTTGAVANNGICLANKCANSLLDATTDVLHRRNQCQSTQNDCTCNALLYDGQLTVYQWTAIDVVATTVVKEASRLEANRIPVHCYATSSIGIVATPSPVFYSMRLSLYSLRCRAVCSASARKTQTRVKVDSLVASAAVCSFATSCGLCGWTR